MNPSAADGLRGRASPSRARSRAGPSDPSASPESPGAPAVFLVVPGLRPYFSRMAREVEIRFVEALEEARSTLEEVATGLGVSRSALRAYYEGAEDVPPAVARELVDYLRERATDLADRADILEEALEREG